MKKLKMYLLLIIISLMVLPLESIAQPDDPNDVPIDGGLSLLLAAGAAYGIKKYRDHKKKQGEEEGQDLK